MKIWEIVVSIVVFVFCAAALMAQSGAILVTGTFHGAAYKTAGRATIYQAPGGDVLRLTHFTTSNGPNLHILLIAASDAQDDENFLDRKIERIHLGKLKGNDGDQNYAIPAGTDIAKFNAVSVFCERFNANFGTAPLEK